MLMAQASALPPVLPRTCLSKLVILQPKVRVELLVLTTSIPLLQEAKTVPADSGQLTTAKNFPLQVIIFRPGTPVWKAKDIAVSLVLVPCRTTVEDLLILDLRKPFTATTLAGPSATKPWINDKVHALTLNNVLFVNLPPKQQIDGLALPKSLKEVRTTPNGFKLRLVTYLPSPWQSGTRQTATVLVKQSFPLLVDRISLLNRTPPIATIPL